MKRHTPLRRGGRIERRTRLRPVSARRAREAREYAKAKVEFLREHPFCEICGRRTQDVHHKAGRLGGNFLDRSTWMSLCRLCYDWIHQHPAEARALGWLK